MTNFQHFTPLSLPPIWLLFIEILLEAYLEQFSSTFFLGHEENGNEIHRILKPFSIHFCNLITCILFIMISNTMIEIFGGFMHHIYLRGQSTHGESNEINTEN
jgi:hypothetical protein